MTAPTPGPRPDTVGTPGRLGVLADRRFAWYFVARSVSLFGSSMAPIALTFAVLRIAGSAGDLALVMGVHTTALVAFLLFGGVVADRLPRVAVLQWSHALAAITQGLAATLILTNHATIPRLAAIEVVNGAVSAFTMPAMVGILPSVVDRARIQQANALLSLVKGGLRVLGPALGGALVVTAGPGWALAIDALSYAVAVTALSRIRLPQEQGTRGNGLMAELREGWGEFRRRQWVWVVVVDIGIINAIGIGVVGVVGPLIAIRTPSLGEAGWGLALAAEAAGTVVMTVILLRVRLGRPLLVGQAVVALMAAPMILLGVKAALAPLAIAFFICGLAVETFAIAWETALQQHVPQAVLSRVSAYDSLGSFVGMPVGMFVFGWLATRFPPGEVAIAGGIAYAVIALAALLSPDVRGLRSLEVADE